MASFDADDGPTQLRLRGNEAYKNKEYDTAIELYSQVIAICEHDIAHNDRNSINSGNKCPETDIILALGNRSACYLAQRQWSQAATDARAAHQGAPENEKYCHRLVLSLREMAEEFRQIGEGNADEKGRIEAESALAEADAALSRSLQKNPNSSVLKALLSTNKVSNTNRARNTTLLSAMPKNYPKVQTRKETTNADLAATQGVFRSEDQYCSPCDPPPSSEQISRVGNIRRSAAASGEHGAIKPSAFLLETSPQAAYTDEQYLMLVHLKEFINKVQKGHIRTATQEHILSGYFKQLCNSKEQFFECLFPGTSSHTRQHLPQNLQELLLWPELVLDLTAIAIAAAKVLDGVRAKGAQRGDTMDKETRDMLIPQIAQEALARELGIVMKTMSKNMSRLAARDHLAIASPTAPQAMLDQLDDDVIEGLRDERWAVQAEYLGADWASLVCTDIMNFSKFEHMSDIFDNSSTSSSGESGAGSGAGAVNVRMPVRLAWLEKSYADYPALTEAMNKLTALPYEINNVSSKKETRLLCACPCSERGLVNIR